MVCSTWTQSWLEIAATLLVDLWPLDLLAISRARCPFFTMQDREPLESVPRLKLELKNALAEKEALERRLKQLLGRERASYLPGSASGSSDQGACDMGALKAGMAADAMASSRPAGRGPQRAGPSTQNNSQVLPG